MEKSGVLEEIVKKKYVPPAFTRKLIQDVLAKLEEMSYEKPTPLQQAQDLIYEACDWDRRTGVELAKAALSISADCADAYVFLARGKPSLEAKAFYEAGVQAGERALGQEAFQKSKGHFWGIFETRPYMRARLGLANCLWDVGERRASIEHLEDMLKLNPNDNQGLRYILIDRLLEENLDQAVDKLLRKYKGDCSAHWGYAKALWMFRQEGKSKTSDAFLRIAFKRNRFVPDYLLGVKKAPKRLPDHIGFGNKDEAVAYAADSAAVWRKTEGALSWLADVLKKMGVVRLSS